MDGALQILGWTVTGLRCPDHKVCFERAGGAVRRVTLIQMPNGTGKTTTLQLLRGALSGRDWAPQEVRALRKRGSSAARGTFEIRMRYGDRQLTVEIAFHFSDGTAAYKTTFGPGQTDGFHPPRSLGRFLRPQFVDFFIFDGELAARLLDHAHTNAQCAIEDLFQLTLFAQLAARAEKYWQEYTKGRTATEERGLARRQKRVQVLDKRLKKIQSERKALEKQHRCTKKALEAMTTRFYNALKHQGAVNDQLRQIAGKLQSAERRCTELAQYVLRALREPHTVSMIAARETIALRASLDRLKLPESTAREFFEELAAETHCVCGRELDAATRAFVRNQSHKYLGSDDVALLNAIKSDIGQIVEVEPEAGVCSLKRYLQDLRDGISQRRDLQNEQDRIQAKAADQDPETKDVKKEVAALANQLQTLDRKLEKYDDKTGRDEEVFDLDELGRRLRKAKKDLDEVRDTLTLGAKRDVLVKVLNAAQSHARTSLSKAICEQTNARIDELMPDNAIRVSEISDCLRLSGQEGGSAGETLSIGYAFLSTLLNRSGEQVLPFIVDSPAGPIDYDIRPRIGQLIPKLSQQFIAFVISSERPRFVPSLQEASADGEIQFLTVFRKGGRVSADQARRHEHVETGDGICVSGIDFFNEFQLDAEAGTNGVL